MSIEERLAELEAEMAAIREAAAAEGRAISGEERERFNELSIQRAAAYRQSQQERARKSPQTIVTSEQIFRGSVGRGQGRILILVVIGLAVVFGLLRAQNPAPDRNRNLIGEQPVPAEPALIARMPPADLIPASLILADETGVSRESIVSAWENPEAHRQRLVEWGFTHSASRTYEPRDGLSVEDAPDLAFLHLQLSQFGSLDQAIAAAAFQWSETIARSGPEAAREPIVVETIGDHTVACRTPFGEGSDRRWEIMLWVVDGPFVYRYATSTDAPDVPDSLTAIATGTLQRVAVVE
ncbi:MAG: hypothetical protein ACRD1H_06200 [Vicinamibacterales bacterium]